MSSKSEERREIFEEAAGIAKYRYRKNEAERRLRSTEDNLLRLRDILQELEERVGPLEQQAEKAKKFLAYAGEKKGLEIGLWLHTIEHSREVLRELNSKLELARTQYDAAGDAIAAVDEEIEAIAQRAQQLVVQMDEVRRSAQALEEEAARRDGEAAVLGNDLFHNGENIARIRAEMEQAESGKQTLEADIVRHQEDIAQKREEIAAAEAERLARQRLEAETERAAAIAGELSETRNRLAAERQAFTRRMDRVAEEASRHCAGLPAGWVRLYNEALGLAPAAPEASAPAAGIGAPAGSASATGAGVRSGASVMVSPEDLLAHARDYGGYCRNLRAQAEALLAVEKGREVRP